MVTNFPLLTWLLRPTSFTCRRCNVFFFGTCLWGFFLRFFVVADVAVASYILYMPDVSSFFCLHVGVSVLGENTHTHIHARTHARTHVHTRARAHTHTVFPGSQSRCVAQHCQVHASMCSGVALTKPESLNHKPNIAKNMLRCAQVLP